MILKLAQTHRRLLLNNGQILRINQLNHDIDTGLYQCIAANFLGNISATIYLNVLGKLSFFYSNGVSRNFLRYYKLTLIAQWKNLKK